MAALGAIILTLAGCTSQAPPPTTAATPSPTSTPSPALGTTPPTTPAATPTSTATVQASSGEFPATLLGLPVLSVAEMARLSTTGKLNGRFAAVGGYWSETFAPCPLLPHRALLDGSCYFAGFADSPTAAVNVSRQGNSFAPIAGPEASNADMLLAVQQPDVAVPVVLVVHGNDSRARQCAPGQRSACQRRLVIDSVAWANGSATVLPASNSDVTTHLTAGDVAVDPDRTVLAYPTRATSLQVVDPQFAGQAEGVVWLTRVVAEAPDADGTAAGLVTLVDDATGANIASLPLGVDADYAPGRITVDARGSDNLGYPQFTVTGTRSIVAEFGVDDPPVVLDADSAGYVLSGFLVDGANHPIVDWPTCDQELTVDSSADLFYTATFSSTGCLWAEGPPA